jgi:hypothetical protein
MNVDTQPHCQIDYLPDSLCIVQTWCGFAESAKFRVTIEKTIAFASSNLVRSIISDTREQKIVGADDITWLATVGNPRLVALGVRKLAFIAPRDAFTRMGENSYATLSRGQLEIRWFADFSQALAWAEIE